MRKKMWRCKFCDNRQNFHDTICKNCGQDLTMGMGEIYFEGQDEQPKPQQKGKSKKGLLLVILAVAVAAALAVVGVLIWMNGDNDETPDSSDPVSTGTFTKPTAEATTEPDTEPTTEPTVPPTTVPKYNAVAVAPDFENFAGIYAELNKADANDFGCWKIYDMESAEAAEQVFQEYRDLLTSYYPYVQVEAFEGEVDGWQRIGYCYDHTGQAETTEFLINFDGENKTCLCDMIVYLTNKDDTYLLYVYYAKEIEFEDRGARTTYEPNGATVTGVTLDCYDLLWDRDTSSQVDWVPEGYVMEYDVIVSYTGTKTKPFTAKVTSSDESVLKVYEDYFLIEAVSPGTATITVTCSGSTDSVEITVCPVDSSDGAYMEIEVGEITTDADGKKVVPITETVHFGSEVGTANILWIAKEGIEYVDSTSWEEQEDHVYSRVVTVTYDESVIDEPGEDILFYLVKAGDYGNKDPLHDMMDFMSIVLG